MDEKIDLTWRVRIYFIEIRSLLPAALRLFSFQSIASDEISEGHNACTSTSLMQYCHSALISPNSSISVLLPKACANHFSACMDYPKHVSVVQNSCQQSSLSSQSLPKKSKLKIEKADTLGTRFRRASEPLLMSYTASYSS